MNMHFVRREEVSHAISHNEADTAKEANLVEINSNPKLKEYFDSLRSSISSSFVGCKTLSSKLVDASSPANLGMIESAADMIPLPIVPNIVKALCKVKKIKGGIDLTNNVTRMLKIAATITEFESLLDNAAITITLSKKDLILALEEGDYSQMSFLGKIRRLTETAKGKIWVDARKNIIEKEALKDAGLIVTKMMMGEIDPDLNKEEQIVEIIISGEIEKYILTLPEDYYKKEYDQRLSDFDSIFGSEDQLFPNAYDPQGHTFDVFSELDISGAGAAAGSGT